MPKLIGKQDNKGQRVRAFVAQSQKKLPKGSGKD
jgi:hypothetical protein